METNISHCDFNENDIKPMEFAMSHFETIPSVFTIHSVIMNEKVYESFLTKFNGKIRREFDTSETEMFEILDQTKILNDRFVAAVNVKPDFYENFDATLGTVVLSVTMTDDTFKYVINTKKPKLRCRFTVYYTDQKLLNEFVLLLKDVFTPDKDKAIDNNSYISLVIKRPNGSLDTSDFEIKNPKINIPLSYGEEFEAIDKNIFTSLTKSDKGLWIFHGPPGTGKSMYIRNVIKKLNKSGKVGSVIYMPSEMVGSIESPEFIPFIQDYQDSVLVIEDGDIALESRKNHGSIVKTILQLTDGILADCLRLKIIVTFNCELSKIDEALLRKGRLQIRHEFRYLNRTEAMKLAESLKIDVKIFDTEEYSNKKEWTLAEIYNIHTDFYWDKKQKKLGFGK